MRRRRIPRPHRIFTPVFGAVALAPLALGQTQFEERLPRRYVPMKSTASYALGLGDLDGDGTVDVLSSGSGVLPSLFLNQGLGVFEEVGATNLPPAISPATAAVVGDLDGDGDRDVVLGSSGNSSQASTLLLNDGSASFVEGVLPPTFARITGLSLGDLDGDGRVDLAASMGNVFQSAGLYLGDGLGGFTDASPTSMPSSNTGAASAIDLADVDGDGDLDIGLASSGSPERIYENGGLGVFTYSFANFPDVRTDFSQDLVFADLDLDGDRDLAVAATSGRNVLYHNNGSGVFRDRTTLLPADSDSSHAVDAGDLNGDAFPDLVFGSYGQSRTYHNDGAGAFVEWPQPGLEELLTYDAALADLDQDGDLDLFFANIGQDRLALNDGAGTLVDAAPERLPFGYYDRAGAIEAADLDGDGDRDLVVATGLYGTYDGGSRNQVYFGRGAGSFSTGVLLGNLSLSNTVSFAVGDVDGDQDPDVVLGNALLCGLGYSGFNCEPQSNRLLLNDGGGGFSEGAGLLPVDDDDTLALDLGDVDSDGDLDLVAGNSGSRSRLYENSGAGSFVDVTVGHLPNRVDATRALALADMDADGDLDLLVGNQGQQDRQYVNEGLGAFYDDSRQRMPSDTRKTRALAVADVDLDGDLDLVLGREGQPGLYLNQGTGVLLDRSDRFPMLPDEAWAVELGDVDDDGDLDVVLGCQTAAGAGARNRMLVNDGTTRFADVSTARLPADADRTAALELVDVDGDGDLDLFAGTTRGTLSTGHVESRFYLNLHRQLEARVLAILGRTWELELHAQPGYGASPLTAVVALSLALLPTPMTDPVSGTLYLADPLVFPEVVVPSATGRLVLPINVPPAPGLAGLTFYAQGGILEDGALRLTGYLEETFTR